MNALYGFYKKMERFLSRWTAIIEYRHRVFYKRKFLTALFLNIAILFFTVCFGYIRYETSDDYLPAFYVSGVFGEYTHQLIYMNTLYTRFLVFLSSTLKEFPWYATVLFSLSFIGMTHFIWLLLSFNPKCKLVLSYIILVVVLWFGLDIYTAIQYTKVAMLLSGPALWGVFALFLSGKTLRDSKSYFVFCAILFQIGGLIRFQTLFFLIVMTPVICAVMFLSDVRRKSCWKESISQYIRFGICFVCFFVIAGAFFGYHKYVYNSTPYGRFVMERDRLSHMLMNYSSISYEQHENVYKKIGFSKADVALLEHWYIGSPEYYTDEKLDYLVSETSSLTLLKTNPKQFFHKRFVLLKNQFKNARMAAVLFLLLFGVFFLKNKNASFWGGALAYYTSVAVLAYRARIVDRVVYCMLLFALTSMIYGLQNASVCQRWNMFHIGKVYCVKLLALAAGLILLAGPVLSCLNYYFVNGEAHYLRKTQNGAKDVLDYISTHKDMVFAASGVFTFPFRGAQPFRKMVFGQYSNFVPVHGCLMCCSPQQFSQNDLTITDFPKQFVDKDNLYLISLDDKKMILYQVDVFLDFIKEHYYPDVKVKKIKSFDSGFSLYKYYIEPSDGGLE